MSAAASPDAGSRPRGGFGFRDAPPQLPPQPRATPAPSSRPRPAVEDETMAVTVHISGGQGLVWSIQEASVLRERHRIVGNAAGSMPGQAGQNMFFSLPVILGPEEVSLLLAKGIGRVVGDHPVRPPTALEAQTFQAERAEFEERQLNEILSVHDRRAEYFRRFNALNKADKASSADTSSAANGTPSATPPRSKPSPALPATSPFQPLVQVPSDDDEDSDSQPAKRSRREDGEGGQGSEPSAVGASTPSIEQKKRSMSEAQLEKLRGRVRVLIPYSSGRTPFEPVRWTFPDPDNEMQVIRTRVYQDLWERGYYLTTATKFGGDFLVYPGDPHRYHSHFVAICVSWTRVLSPLDIVSFGRLGTVVKKAPLICSLAPDGRIRYLSIEWTGAN